MVKNKYNVKKEIDKIKKKQQNMDIKPVMSPDHSNENIIDGT